MKKTIALFGSILGQIATGMFVYAATENFWLAAAAFNTVFAICCQIDYIGHVLKK